MSMKFNFIVIGGGIVGLATAWQLQKRYSHKKILLIEKENNLGKHQTGHNSGVIHSGVYYEPGSLKARFCKQGLLETINFCKKFHIPYEQCGKLIVATEDSEINRMHALFERSKKNHVDCELISSQQLHELEPNINGLGAIIVSDTGIVDYNKICEILGKEFCASGGKIELESRVLAIEENDSVITLSTSQGKRQTELLISCAGLQADRLVKLHGLRIDFQIIPFRGEYFKLSDHQSDKISHLIYPVPDPELPFLGIHLTRMIDGGITVGPNAVLGWKREGYGHINFSLRDTLDTLIFPGFWKLSIVHFKHGLHELKNSLNKGSYLKHIQKYFPLISENDLLPYPGGVRAQAVLSDGTLVDDFLFAESQRSIHVCNAPSPAATSALPINGYICDKITEKMHFLS